MTARSAAIVFVLGAAAAFPVLAATPLDLYKMGQYSAATQAGCAQNTAAGYALAARAELAEEMMRSEPCMACLKEAEGLAAKAVAMDPRIAEGHIEYVVALGYEARLMGMMEAHFRHYDTRAKEQIDAALEDDPSNAWALAALGGWNIEIAHMAGKTLARWLYGASLDAGLKDFQKAFAVAPDSVVLHYQYALSLASYDSNGYRDAIGEALAQAIADRPQSAYETFAQNNARALLSALKSGDMDEFHRLVRHDQGYP